MNIRALLVAATVTACLTGCVTPAQFQGQNDQLQLINANLRQIQANQAQALQQQKAQTSLLMQGNALQAMTSAQGQEKEHGHD